MRLLALWWGKLVKLAATVDAFYAFDCLPIHALHIKKKLNAKAMAVCGTPQTFGLLYIKNVDAVHACLARPSRLLGEIGSYLGGAARLRACSHGQLHTLFSCPTLTNLSPTLKPLKEYDETDI
ncbi:hypothetical protein Tco_0413528 [Tanacetum coccineum]